MLHHPSRRAPKHVVVAAAVAACSLAAVSPLRADASAQTDRSWTANVAPDLLAQLGGVGAPRTQTTSSDTGSATVSAIVNLDAPVTVDAADVAALQEAAMADVAATGAEVTHRYENIPAMRVSVDRNSVEGLAELGSVSFIEEVPVMQTLDTESFPLTNTDDAHAAGFTGAGTTIAIIDDGVDASHEAFDAGDAFPNDKVIGGIDVADGDNDPSIDCVEQSHGTATSGVAAANGGGITGTAPDAKLVVVKVQSSGLCGSGSLDGDIVEGIDWAISNQSRFGINIISMSLGGGSYRGACDSQEPATARAVNGAVSSGMLVFAASGNSNTKSAMSAPACISNVISVGAVYDANLGSVRFSICSDTRTSADFVTCYSNSDTGLDLLAPSNNAFTAAAGGGSTSTFGGTSSATPFAAGVAADALAAGASPGEILDLLRRTGKPVTDSRNGRTTPRVDTLAAAQGA
jgi:subtilisin family serine protease